MIKHCLYGVEVFAEFALFEHNPANSALAPGEERPLQLQQVADNRQWQNLSETVPLHNTHGRELSLLTDRQLASSENGQPWRLEVEGVVNFYWVGGHDTIFYQLLPQGTSQLLAFWFVHIFLPLHLTLERGYDFIHCAAVEVNDKPVLFIAPSTGGKSTLGDYFLKRGHPMLSDDKAATFLYKDQLYAVPSHPHHRPFRQFEVLGHAVNNFSTCAKPIHAFYILEAGDPDSTVEISEVNGFRKFEELMPNYLYNFSFLKRQRLQWLAQLADQSLVFRLRRPWNMERMHEVYTAVCKHGGHPRGQV